MLRHYRLTPSQFGQLPASDQEWMLGYEVYRRRKLAEWRKTLIGEENGKSNLTPESATLMVLDGL